MPILRSSLHYPKYSLLPSHMTTLLCCLFLMGKVRKQKKKKKHGKKKKEKFEGSRTSLFAGHSRKECADVAVREAGARGGGGWTGSLSRFWCEFSAGHSVLYLQDSYPLLFS